ncbi:DUF6069 family protein [Nocardioides sp. SYSU D00065]|uniref:DUF6069 family protein n=1 Tax=Nocardioides sp. SYSU D00065 TaxID=2817378 RepID=UPI001B345078|nr:DUF6069 family protein [Nocardioides sp. SYSU D00065]
MTSTGDRALAPPAAAVSRGRRYRRLLAAGLAATVAAMVATTLAAALARAAGIVFELPEGGGEAIPLSGFAMMTGIFSLVGVGIAAALLSWSAPPARRFVQVAVALTAVSLVPPFVVGASAATAGTLVVLHLIPAAIVIPVLARAVRVAAR